MLTDKARIVGLLGLVVLLLGGAIGVWSTAPFAVAAADSKDSKVKSLLKERHAIVKDIVTETTKEYRAGQASFANVHEANQAMHRAELDLCDTAGERVMVLEKMLAEAKAYEKHVDASVKTGGLASSAALKAKVDRLDVEIALVRAKG
jgi:hypothetical protein